jgi:hypothetical protein
VPVLAPLVLVASLYCVAAAPPPSEAGALSTLALHERGQRPLRLAEASGPETAGGALSPPRLSLTDADPLAGTEPLDTGGGVSAQTRQVLALVLGLVIGFGIGHLVARDMDGFVLFLLVDVAIITVMIVLGEAVHGVFWTLGAIGLVVSHVIQGLDAYHSAGGQRLIQWWRERAVRVVSSDGDVREAPAITTRVLALRF